MDKPNQSLHNISWSNEKKRLSDLIPAKCNPHQFIEKQLSKITTLFKYAFINNIILFLITSY